jgi:hypothetical protein
MGIEVMIKLAAFAFAIFVGCPIALADETVYFSDDFSSQAFSDYYWAKSCSDKGHSSGRKYPYLGQASRAGSCIIELGHERFITQPFDVRLPMGADFFKGSGGSEIEPISGRGIYPDDFLDRGWDLTGQTYAAADKEVGYEWDFRLVSLSLIQAGLVRHAAIGQFHSQNDPNGPCGSSIANSSPSPGFDVAMIDADHVKFTVYIKPIYNQVPTELGRWIDRSCSANPDQPCQMVLWRGVYPLSDMTNHWLHISFIMKSARDASGSFAFSFGRKDKAAPADEVYQSRILVTGSPKINVPMTGNNCPNRVVLGIYAQGYNDDLYGITNGERVANGPSWVSPMFYNMYSRFINGLENPYEHPPQIVVDYDNFRVFKP